MFELQLKSQNKIMTLSTLHRCSYVFLWLKTTTTMITEYPVKTTNFGQTTTTLAHADTRNWICVATVASEDLTPVLFRFDNKRYDCATAKSVFVVVVV